MAGTSKRLLVFSALAFFAYIAAVLLHAVLWADIISPIFDLLAAAVIFHAVFTSGNKLLRVNFLLTGAAILLWGVADALWLVYDAILHIDPDSSLLITFCYSGTNLFLIAATMYYAFTRLRKWNTVQLVLDGIVFSIAILWLLWIVLYSKDLSKVERLLEYSLMNSLTIAMDIFLLIVTGIWYLSIRKGRLSPFMRILVGSLDLYVLTDLFYYHLYAHGNYIADSYLDICYLTALFGMAISIALYYIKYPSVFQDGDSSTNIGYRHRGIFLVCFPLLILLLGTIDTVDLILYAALLLIHEFGSSYIQKAISNKILLSQEQDMNKRLEQRVAEQTQSLKSANTELRRQNTKLQYLNYHDSLTGLYNRVYFIERLEELIGECAAEDSVVLVIWNIDKLKSINGTYGYTMGDRLLAWHAKQVQAQFGDQGMLARLGSDEFAYADRGRYQIDDLIPLAQHVLNTFKEPLRVNEYVFHIMASAGICTFPLCASDAISLLKNADIAMRHAKAMPAGPHIARYLDVDESIRRKNLLAGRLKTAQYQQELSLHFQPQFRISDRRLTGMEALLRWNCPDLGPVSPAEFIPIAEEQNLIIPIGRWVMENAVRQIAQWNTAYRTDLRMGINFSPRQLGQRGTLEELRELVTRYQAQYRWIDIEITESVALDNEDDAGKIKEFFHNSGISISIDDFGTGYSSMGYLSILSFDRLKIAKPLIDKITFDESSRKIITSIVLLAKSLGLETLSEGVETEEQFNLLREIGCDQIQGFYLGKPATAAAFEAAYLQPHDS